MRSRAAASGIARSAISRRTCASSEADTTIRMSNPSAAPASTMSGASKTTTRSVLR